MIAGQNEPWDCAFDRDARERERAARIGRAPREPRQMTSVAR